MRKTHTFGGSRMKAAFVEDFDLFKQFKELAKERYRQRVNLILHRLTERVMISTAVWEGETLANWRWSVGSPATGNIEAFGTDDPGPTNTMQLGAEPRRGANERPMLASLSRIKALKTLPDKIFLTNTGTIAMEMEYGMVPGAPGQRVRSEGMLRLAVAEAAILRI